MTSKIVQRLQLYAKCLEIVCATFVSFLCTTGIRERFVHNLSVHYLVSRYQDNDAQKTVCSFGDVHQPKFIFTVISYTTNRGNRCGYTEFPRKNIKKAKKNSLPCFKDKRMGASKRQAYTELRE